MSIFDKIKGIFQSSSPATPAITFGRFTDIYRGKAKHDAYDKAIKLFDNERFMEAYEAFFEFLVDENLENVRWEHTVEGIQFHIHQGSRVINGSIDSQKIRAVGLIAKAETTNVGFMRRLMEFNFNLKHCRFALTPDNFVAVVFDTHVADGSPQKLYYALRELCINADKQDDLLLDEFKSLEPAPQTATFDIPQAEKEVKYAYLIKEIKRTFETLDANKPDQNLYPGGYVYLLLWLVYKLDYLLRPEGFMMDILEKTHRDFFASGNEKTVHAKILDIRKSLQKLLDRPKEEHFKEMYRTRSTFGVTTPVSQEHFFNFLDTELPNMEWYKKNEHFQLALAVPGYIVGYAMFNFALPQPLRDSLHLLMQLMEPEFFIDLGFPLQYFDEKGAPKTTAIKKAVNQLAAKHRERFPNFKPNTQKLKFDGLLDFSRSFLQMLRECDFTKKED